MQLPGKLTLEEALKLRKLTGAASWYRATLSNLGIATFLLIPAIFAFQIAFTEQAMNTSDQLWVYVGSPILAAAIYLASRYHVRAGLTRMIEELPELYDVADTGIRFNYRNGVNTFTPWSLYSSWELTDAFFLLRVADQVRWVASLRGVTPAHQEDLRRILTQNLAELKA